MIRKLQERYKFYSNSSIHHFPDMNKNQTIRVQKCPKNITKGIHSWSDFHWAMYILPISRKAAFKNTIVTIATSKRTGIQVVTSAERKTFIIQTKRIYDKIMYCTKISPN